LLADRTAPAVRDDQGQRVDERRTSTIAALFTEGGRMKVARRYEMTTLRSAFSTICQRELWSPAAVRRLSIVERVRVRPRVIDEAIAVRHVHARQAVLIKNIVLADDPVQK
jgi:hypothetical protein